jgi:mRNA interferase MazF
MTVDHISSAGEIWLARLDPVEGHEQAGTRPVLLVSGARYNRLQPRLRVILPLTTRDRELPFHVRIDPHVAGLRAPSFVLCEQPRTIATSRLMTQWGQVPDDIMTSVRVWIADFLDT